MQASANNRIAVGEFWFDAAQQELFDQSDEPRRLRPQSTQVLNILVAHRGEVVTKTQLMDTVWADFSVTDDSLVQCITEIRRAFGASGRSLLKTVPRRGYMLVDTTSAQPIARLSEQNDAITNRVAHLQIERLGSSTAGQLLAQLGRPKAEVQLNTPARTVLQFQNARLAIQAALTALESGGDNLRIAVTLGSSASHATAIDAADVAKLSAVIQFAGPGEMLADEDVRQQATDLLDCLFVDRGEFATVEIKRRLFGVYPIQRSRNFLLDASFASILPTVAIIPPATRQSATEKTLSDVFTDDVIACLSRLPEVSVISRLSSAVFRSRDAQLSEIRDALNADYVLSGVLQTRSGNMGFSLELSKLSDGTVVWADRIEFTEQDIVDSVDVVQKVVSRILNSIAVKSAQDVRRRGLDNVENHSLLFAAIRLMHRLTPRDFETAKEMLSKLNARCPAHATPLAWLARWHVLGLQQGWTSDARRDANAALDCAHRALDLEPENALALTSRGHVLTNLWRELEDAEICYDAALDSNPSEATALILRGMLYGYQDRGEEAKRDAERALHLTPFDPHRFFFLALAAGANLAAGDNERALELSNDSLRLNLNHTSTLRGKIAALKRLGRDDEANSDAARLLRQQPDFRVSKWLATTPAADFEIGKTVATALKEAGLPD